MSPLSFSPTKPFFTCHVPPYLGDEPKNYCVGDYPLVSVMLVVIALVDTIGFFFYKDQDTR